jgi:hypothetical protein
MAPFKMKSPLKQKFGLQGLKSSEKTKFFKESKKRAKEAFKRDAAKSGHGTIEDLKAKSKGIKRKPKLTTTAKTKILKQVAKKGIGRLAGGLLGGLGGGIAGLAYEAYKSGQKHSGGKVRKGQKSLIAGAKKKTKSIFKK